ncbi:MFS transporter [Shigella flexneri]|nr:MFS transporter [Shigella flexneri]
MSTYTRPVMLLLSGLLLLTLAIAVLNTLVPLWLAQEHMSTWQVGVVSSSYFTGNLVGTLLTGYVIKRIGFNRSYYLSSFIFAAGCAGLGLMPLYLNHKGVSNASIGFWMAVLVSAGILGQWPIGRLADKFGRLLVLRVQVFVVILGSIAMLSQAAMAPALFILGAAGFTLYPVAMAWACEKVEHHQLVAMNQALLLSYTVGSLLGPSFSAMLMQNFSDNLLFIMIASVSFIYLLMLLRNAGHTPKPVAHV